MVVPLIPLTFDELIFKINSRKWCATDVTVCCMLRYISPALIVWFVSTWQFVDIDLIFNNTSDVLEENSTIYIAMDEHNRTYFDLLQKHYKTYFINDFKDLLEGVNMTYFGMVDQLIASRGRTIIGTHLLTFTGYINPIREYHSQQEKAKGYELGVINSYFGIPLSKKYDMREYHTFKPPWWWFAREYPIGW